MAKPIDENLGEKYQRRYAAHGGQSHRRLYVLRRDPRGGSRTRRGRIVGFRAQSRAARKVVTVALPTL